MFTKFYKLKLLKGKFPNQHSLLVFILLFISSVTTAQFQTFEWARYGKGSGKENGSFVGTDANSNIYVIGSYEITTDFDPGAGVSNLTGVGKGDIFIKKSDPNGILLWAKQISSLEHEYVSAMTVDPAGNIYLGISYQGMLDVDPNSGITNVTVPSFGSGVALIKLNTNGLLLWVKQFGGTNQNLKINALDINSSNNVIVAGEFINVVDINFDAPQLLFNVMAGAYMDSFIMEVSLTGSFIWAKQLPTTSNIHFMDSNYPEAIVVDDNDNIIVTGWLWGEMDLDPGSGTVIVNANNSSAVYVAKYSSTGTFLWGGGVIGTSLGIWPGDIKTDANENVYVAMYSFGGNIDFDITAGTSMMNTWSGVPCILKLSSGGSFVWSKTFQQSGWSSVGIKLEVSQGSTPYVFMAACIRHTKDLDPNVGVVNVTATTPYFGPSSEDEALVLKLTSNGEYYDHCVFAGSDDEAIRGMVLGPGFTLYLTGLFKGAVDFDGSSAISIKQSKGSEDIFYLRLNHNLDHFWSHSIGSNGLTTIYASSKKVSTHLLSGGYVLGSSARDLPFGNLEKNAMISITSAAGLVGIPSFEFGGPGEDEVTAVYRDAQGNNYIAGTFEQTANLSLSPYDNDINRTSAGGKDLFIMKVNSVYETVWVKRIGGTYDEEIEALTVHGNSIYLTGAYKGTVDFNPNASTFNMVSNGNTFDIFVMKLDTSGTFGWAKSIGSSTAYDSGRGIATDPSGNVLVTGYYSGAADFDPNAGVFNMTSIAIADIFVLKLNSAGNLVWAKSIGSSSSSDDVGADIVSDNAGNVYHTGYFKYTADFDPGPGVYNLSTTGGSANNDGYIQKLDPNGNHLWTGHLKGTGNDRPDAITIDFLNNVYVTGSFSGTIDMDPFISQTQNLTAAGGTDGFVLSLRVADSTCWFYKIGGATSDNATGIAVDSAFNVYTVGNFSGTVDFDPFPSTFAITANGSPMDMFTLKLGQVSPLPIELLLFTAEPVDNQYIRCDWMTSSELDNDYFTVERSKNGSDFEIAGVVDGAGTTSSSVSYSFLDKQPHHGLSYYRLKQTDYDGRSTYSDVVPVMLSDKNSLVGLPNPASDQFSLYFDTETYCNLSVTDINGKVVYEKSGISSGHTIYTSGFSAGLYQVKIFNEVSAPMFLKLIVKN